MTFDEAKEHVEQGGRATCRPLPSGAVLKLARASSEREPSLRVVFEATGDSFEFQRHTELLTAEWSKVEGWVSYG